MAWLPITFPSSASYALTASYVDRQFYASYSASLNVTWSFTHNLNARYPIVTVWDLNNEVVIPQKIHSPSVNQTIIYFPVSQSGFASATVGSILPTSEVDPIFSSKSGSYATTGSNTFVGSEIVSGSVTITGSLSVIGTISASFIGNGSGITNVASSSFSATSSFLNEIFSRGASIADVTNGVSTTGSYYVWRCPYTCRVQSLYGKKSGTGTSQINARKSGSGGYSYHTASNLSLSVADQWTAAASVQNTDYASGDSLEIIITGSGATQIAVQVDYRRI